MTQHGDCGADGEKGEKKIAAVHEGSTRVRAISFLAMQQRPILHAIASLSLFASIYFGTFVLASFALRGLTQWAWLVAGSAATFAAIMIAEHGEWRVGLAARPFVVLRELGLGALFAFVLLAAADMLVLSTTSLMHAMGSSFPWRELFAVYLPAAVHEEIVFRGYPLQKLRTIDTRLAVALTSIVFALMHLGNRGITPLAFLDILLGGVLLALLFLRCGRLWIPIGFHLAWNVISGPILGYDVSGFVPSRSVLTLRGDGTATLTGGSFGIEGSVWTVLVEVVGISILLLNAHRKFQDSRRST
jgi:membrane protease YdiL (CAAX protease family)